MQNKEQLRKKYLKKRKKNYFEVKLNFFNPLIRLIKKKFDAKTINISLYYPANFEVNTLKFFDYCNLKGIKTLLPIILNKNKMKFFKWKYKEDVLFVNKFGILEPKENNKNFVPQIILIPLLAFDNNKFRLGYGKGYYDIFLKKLLLKHKNIIIIGIGFSFQKCNKLPISKHDIKMKYILTEKGLI